MQAIIPRPDIAPILQESFIALAADVDDLEPEVGALVSNLSNAQMLPFIIVTDSDGNFATGFAGAVTPTTLKDLLEGVLA